MDPSPSLGDSREAPLLQSESLQEQERETEVPEAQAVEQHAPGAGFHGQFLDVVAASQEWAGAAAFDSDIETSWDLRGAPERDAKRARQWAKAAGAEPVRPIDVVTTSQEWAASISSAMDSAPLGGHRKQRRVVLPPESSTAMSPPGTLNTLGPSSLGSDFPRSLGSSRSRRACKRRRHFMIFSLLHVADFVMRTWCLIIFAQRKDIAYVCLIAPLQVLGTLASAYITFHDSDVLLWLASVANRRPTLRPVALSMVCFVFSCLQMIQVKRAWARQLHAAEVMTEMTPREDTRAATAGSMRRFGGSERCLPVALFTGVPYLIVLVYALEIEPWAFRFAVGSLDLYVFCTSIVISLLTVSLGIIEIDTAASAYVLKRYHHNPFLEGTCAGRLQFIYAVCHVLFRSAEVTMRVLIIVSFFLTTVKVLGHGLMLIFLGLDYILGVALLWHHAPSEERFIVHVLVGIALLVADLAHFVDQPNFAEPARYISRRLQIWRIFNLVLVVGVSYWTGYVTQALTQRGWDFKMLSLIVSAFLYYFMRYSTPIRVVGHDLHTAARLGHRERIRSLLKPNRGGQVLDVNARTKDTEEMTPAMLAAKAGHLEVLKELVCSGAELNLACASSGDTSLHFAARRGHLSTCRYLLSQGADANLRNKEDQRPQDVVLQAYWGRHSQLQEEFQSVLGGDTDPERPPRTPRRSRLLRSKRFYAVNAENIDSENAKMLQNFFPDVRLSGDLDEVPLQSLHSVSGLLATRAAGVLAHRVLAPMHPSGMLSLGMLRRVGDLGQGGFGRVIEVELPLEAGQIAYFAGGRRSGATRRFALKLQLKDPSQQSAGNEVLALQRASHPFIVKLEKAFQTPKFFALLLELCPTDLNRVLCDMEGSGTCQGLSVAKAAKYMGQVLLALAHLHDTESIVFRDVKPENILISSYDDAKLTDFGLAETARLAEKMSRAGTYGFLPPEMIDGINADSVRGPDGATSLMSNTFAGATSLVFDGATGKSGPDFRDTFKMDAYSFGVTLQLALLGENGGQVREVRNKGPVLLPFAHSEQDNYALLDRMLEAEKLSPEGHQILVKHLLPATPAKRSCLSDEEVMGHPFFLNALQMDDLKDLVVEASSGQFGVGSRSSSRYAFPGSRVKQQTDSSSSH